MYYSKVHSLRIRPKFIKYILIFQTSKGLKLVTTHYYASKLVETGAVLDAWLIDMETETITHIFEDLPKFLEQWEKHYSDPEWKFEKSS